MAVTIYLASVVLLKQTVGRAVGEGGAHVAIITAMPVAALQLVALLAHVRRVRRHSGLLPSKGPGNMVEVTLSEPPC